MPHYLSVAATAVQPVKNNIVECDILDDFLEMFISFVIMMGVFVVGVIVMGVIVMDVILKGVDF